MAAGTTTSGWWPRTYRLAWRRPDLIAGLSTAAVVIPQSMADAALAGLPVETGLYSASVPMVAYALAGISRPLSVSVRWDFRWPQTATTNWPLTTRQRLDLRIRAVIAFSRSI